MKLKELKDKIIIAELDDSKDYIILVDPSLVDIESLKYVQGKNKTFRNMPIMVVRDVNKAIKFVEIPKDNETDTKITKDY